MIYNLSQYNIHWKTKRLNQLGVFSRGKSKHRPRDDYRLFINGKYPLIQTSDIKKANLYVTSHVQEYNEFGLQQSKLWNKGTLCITIAANIADTAIISYPMCFPDSVVGFLANKNESSELFMHYIFKYIQNNIKKTVRGSIQDNININYLEQLYFKIPEKAYQNKIVLILSSIDKKIELNNKINTELEAMAKTIYDYWFLQFEFPNEEGKPYKSSGGKMVWNEELKREIPEGWTNGLISDLGEIISGGTPSTKHDEYYSKNGIAWVTPYDLSKTTDKYITHGEKDISQKGLEKSSAKLMPKGSILLTSRAPIGYIGISSNEVTTNQGFKSIVPYNKSNSEYIYYLLKSIIPYLKSLGNGSTFAEISKETLSNIPIIIPNKDIIDNFNNKVIHLGKIREIKEQENRELTSLRDFLLPLLMNGQVGFKEDKAEG